MLEEEDFPIRELTKGAIWTVSSSKNGYEITNMFDGSMETCWQSDSTTPHWICAQFSRKTYVSAVMIYLCIHQDETYTPVKLVVQIGDEPLLMEDVLEVEPAVCTGWVRIPVDRSGMFIRITIMKNYMDGRDSRIRQLKLMGGPMVPSEDENFMTTEPEILRFLSLR